MKKFDVSTLAEFHKWVEQEVLPKLQPRTLILLEGEVGAGKTELVKTLCQLLNLEDVQSPTFAFHNLYEGSGLRLHHVDLYRLEGEEDLESIGFWDLFENEQDIILVEWSNMIADEAWPWGWNKIKIKLEKPALEEASEKGASAKDFSKKNHQEETGRNEARRIVLKN